MSQNKLLDKATRQTRRRYDRTSRIYDRMEGVIEKRALGGWRGRLWAEVRGESVLEVGVGTGKNIPFYPQGARVVAIDLSPGMLRYARARAQSLGGNVDLREMDVQNLEFPDASFDAALATFVFCSVPYPVTGLEELFRVLKPGSHLYLLEHVLSRRRPARQAMKALNPVVVRMHGANIDRETIDNVRAAGFIVEQEVDLWSDIVKLVVARKSA